MYPSCRAPPRHQPITATDDDDDDDSISKRSFIGILYRDRYLINKIYKKQWRVSSVVRIPRTGFQVAIYFHHHSKKTNKLQQEKNIIKREERKKKKVIAHVFFFCVCYKCVFNLIYEPSQAKTVSSVPQ